MENTITFNTKYGLLSLYKNETYITPTFFYGHYFDEHTLLRLQKYINPNKNILEIGAHCGTSTLVYSSFLNNNSKIFAYEPQKKMYDLLKTNIIQNNLSDKVLVYNKALFCFDGIGSMNAVDIDGGGGNVEKRYTDESHLPCNFGGIGIGKDGEKVDFARVDSLNLDNIGYIHLDAQGAENFILHGAKKLIERDRPVIYFENNYKYEKKFYDIVSAEYPQYEEEGLFDVVKFCESLNYKYIIRRFNGGIDDLCVP